MRLAALLVVLVAAPAQATTLTWHAPSGCPDVASVRARIERRLDRSLDDVSVPVDIEVSRRGGRFIARVDLGALTVANDVRTLTSRRCNELADAVAVIVARVASEALAAAPPPAPLVSRPSPPVRVAARSDNGDSADRPGITHAYQPTPDTYVPRPWTLGARASAINGIGLLPQVGIGSELVVTLRAGNHLAELGAARWFASGAQLHAGSTRRVDVDLDVAVARYGWRPTRMPLRAWLAVEVGSMSGTGLARPTMSVDDGRWIAVGSGFGIAWQMRPWARLFGGTEVMLALDRARFALESGVIAYAPAPMSVRTMCGLEVGWQ